MKIPFLTLFLFLVLSREDPCAKLDSFLDLGNNLAGTFNQDLDELLASINENLTLSLFDFSVMCADTEFNTNNTDMLVTFPNVILVGAVTIALWLFCTIFLCICHPCYRCCPCCAPKTASRSVICKIVWASLLGAVLLMYIAVITIAFFGNSELNTLVREDLLQTSDDLYSYATGLAPLLNATVVELVDDIPTAAKSFVTEFPISDVFESTISALDPILSEFSNVLDVITSPVFSNFNSLLNVVPDLPDLLDALSVLPITFVWGLVCSSMPDACAQELDFGTPDAPNVQTFADVLGLDANMDIAVAIAEFFPDAQFPAEITADFKLADDAYWAANGALDDFLAAISELFLDPTAIYDVLTFALDVRGDEISAAVQGLVPEDALDDILDQISVLDTASHALDDLESLNALLDFMGMDPLEGTVGEAVFFAASKPNVVLDLLWVALLLVMVVVVALAALCMSSCCSCTLNCFSGGSCWLCSVLAIAFGAISLVFGIVCVLFTDVVYKSGELERLLDVAGIDLSSKLPVASLQTKLSDMGINYDITTYLDWAIANFDAILTCQGTDLLHALNIPATLNEVVQASNLTDIVVKLITTDGDLEAFLEDIVGSIVSKITQIDFGAYISDEMRDMIENIVSALSALIGEDPTYLFYAFINGINSYDPDSDTIANIILSYHYNYNTYAGSFLNLCGVVNGSYDAATSPCTQTAVDCISQGDCDPYVDGDLGLFDGYLLLGDLITQSALVCSGAPASSSECVDAAANIAAGQELLALEDDYDAFVAIIDPVVGIISDILMALLQNIEDVIDDLDAMDLSGADAATTDNIVTFCMDDFGTMVDAVPAVVGDALSTVLATDSGAECLSCDVIGDTFESLNCVFCGELPGFFGYTALAVGLLAAAGVASMCIGSCAALWFRTPKKEKKKSEPSKIVTAIVGSSSYTYSSYSD
eukprot:gnl/Chilomastix_cuspidata/116.p1 GENE.gnl/Chilomastix_cuspidata/116~~gnl/Chilomastix_cuspidata/116.p1  ORF type:complete len:940 (-),score=440.70 gnl/Chilomastix_cuspidata/116:653-3472(-)